MCWKSCNFAVIVLNTASGDTNLTLGPNDDGLAVALSYGLDIDAIFQDRNIPLIHINSAMFTETLFKQNKLSVHVFGWDFKETASMLSALETSVQVGGSGFLTMYKMTVDGKVIQETERRMTELGFLLQAIGVANGAFEANDALKEQVVDGLALLRKMDNALTYTITDKLTSLGELESYFSLAIQMNLISRPKLARLVQSLRELRKLGMDDNSFGKVGVKYTFSFDADALGNGKQRPIKCVFGSYWFT
ncbi:MAG: hypothetical protein HOE48_08340 [Candidatus Latescibacteria bacterium]|jgi:hypothetical protein|nr:hypothetical protein [Candidatus Latescibacterota bacterium]MBT4137909.1 hypothetical protein [Candidatus Latescibacterota bacterium]MBT5828973.1 hypothetical protein [Candidatus Latescibacterota bacterium]